MPKTQHQKLYIKYHGKYFDVDVDVTSYMMYVMYDVPNTAYILSILPYSICFAQVTPRQPLNK